MFNQEFFPTPLGVIQTMLSGIDDLEYRCVLEPSAGKGDILDVIKGRTQRCRMYAIENDHQLVEILKGKRYKVVGSDFLQFEPDIAYDLIIMNPPFSNADEHILKAWEIMEEGDIVALCNSETLRNLCSGKRKALAELVADFGTVEELGRCFADSERPTDVEVSLVRITKAPKHQKQEFSFSSENIDFSEMGQPQELATLDILQNVVDDYKRAVKEFEEGTKHLRNAERIVKSICNNYECKVFELADGYGTVKDRVIDFNEQIKIGVWSFIIDKLGIEKYMTSSLQSDFNTFVRQQGYTVISKKNIQEFVAMIMENSGSIMDRCVVEVFDKFTKYYHDNRYVPEGWKTNDSWKVNRKVILPNMLNSDWGSLKLSYSAKREIADIEKAMCYLSGKNFESIYHIADSIGRAIMRGDKTCESEFFRVKFFLKGTMHLEFKDEDLWRDFNSSACAGKNWLPQEEADAWKKRKTERNYSSIS